jgi:arylsulfatase A-like enzyme
MNRRDRWRVAISAVVIVIAAAYVRHLLNGPGIERKPNVLVISMCSFRYKVLQAYNQLRESITPNMDRFIAHSSFQFTNAVNGMPWIAMFTVAESVMPVTEIESYGYVTHSNNTSDYMMRIPGRTSWNLPANEAVDDSYFEKNHQLDTNYFRFVGSRGREPFFLIAHYKYMHYPLIDRFNADADYDHYLTGEERRKLSEYLNHPEKYPEKLPFLLMVADDERIPMSHPRVKALGGFQDPWQRLKVKGLLTDPGMLADWKKSPGYQDDLQLMEKLYAGNARYLDSVIGPALDLWGDPDLRDNTVVVLTGDHGEMHMEHDVLGHGNSLYDEDLKVPMAIRFPGFEAAVKIDSQVNYRMVISLLRGVIKGTVTADNFEEMLARVQEDYLLLRDCVNTRRGLRYKNEYKYVFDIGEDRAYLYDLKNDPGELHDIAGEHPDLVDKFEREFWRLYPTYSRVDPGGCFAWTGGAKEG